MGIYFLIGIYYRGLCILECKIDNILMFLYMLSNFRGIWDKILQIYSRMGDIESINFARFRNKKHNPPNNVNLCSMFLFVQIQIDMLNIHRILLRNKFDTTNSNLFNKYSLLMSNQGDISCN